MNDIITRHVYIHCIALIGMPDVDVVEENEDDDQQDEPTVPSKAALSAFSDVR